MQPAPQAPSELVGALAPLGPDGIMSGIAKTVTAGPWRIKPVRWGRETGAVRECVTSNKMPGSPAPPARWASGVLQRLTQSDRAKVDPIMRTAVCFVFPATERERGYEREWAESQPQSQSGGGKSGKGELVAAWAAWGRGREGA